MNKRYLRLLVVIALLTVSYWITVWQHHHSDIDNPVGELSSVDDVTIEQPRGPLNLANNSSSSSSGSSLPPCPSVPPGLVGPLRIEFDWTRTMNDVRSESSADLQQGGRYQPPDCISQHKVAIIIPFRNRQEHLKHWLYYLHPILKRQQIDYGVYVIHQDGNGTFNRAKLLNVGFVESLKEYAYDCFVFSDVDLVPMDDRNLYRCHSEPRHMASAMDKFGFQMPYKTYFGGVVSLSKVQYMHINGFANEYWGWGAEDDDMYQRIFLRKMTVSRPDSKIGMYKMVRHMRDVHNEENPQNSDRLASTWRNINSDGINTLKYTVKHIDKDTLYTMILVDLHGPK